MHKGFLIAGALLAAVAVGFGAFGAHALKDLISSRAIAIFDTGVRYQFYHVFALLVTAIIFREDKSLRVVWAGRLFIIGIFLFSGSLYALAMIEGMVMPGYKWVGIITPVGGLAFIAGWLLLGFSIFRWKR